jgi:hypothetical protein
MSVCKLTEQYHRPTSDHCHCLWNCCVTIPISSKHFRYPEFLQHIQLRSTIVAISNDFNAGVTIEPFDDLRTQTSTDNTDLLSKSRVDVHMSRHVPIAS